jgi:hypothetical protein
MSNIRIHENGFEITLNDIVINVFEYKDELWKGYVNIVIRAMGDLALRHAFDVDVQGWDNAIKTLEDIERLVSKAIELAKEYKAKGDSNG